MAIKQNAAVTIEIEFDARSVNALKQAGIDLNAQVEKAITYLNTNSGVSVTRCDVRSGAITSLIEAPDEPAADGSAPTAKPAKVKKARKAKKASKRSTRRS